MAILLSLSYNRMSPSPVPIRATRPYRGHADAGPKGVSWGSAIRTRTNSFRDYRAACYPIPHRTLGPRSLRCARQDVNLRCPRPQRGLDAAGVRARSRHPVPTRTAGLTGAGSQPCVTACRRDGGPGLLRAEGAIRTRKPRGLSSRGIPVPVTPASCATRDLNPEPSA